MWSGSNQCQRRTRNIFCNNINTNCGDKRNSGSRKKSILCPPSFSAFTSSSSSAAAAAATLTPTTTTSFTLSLSALKPKSLLVLYALILLTFANNFHVGHCVGVLDEIAASAAVFNGTHGNEIRTTTSADHASNIPQQTLQLEVQQQQQQHEKQSSKHLTKRSENLQITGFRLEASSHEVHYGDDGVPKVLSMSEITIRVFGHGLTDDVVIAFTTQSNEYGGACQFPATLTYNVVKNTANGNTALYKVTLPPMGSDTDAFFLCSKSDAISDQIGGQHNIMPLIHQGSEIWLKIRSYENLLPIWAAIGIICICLCFSALFSGLNLGLMALDRTELKILKNTGTDKEREYAKKIQPVRDQGNFLLCSILLGNVLVNSTFTILLDGLTSGVIAVVCSTLLIVIFGEITPQAICSRHGLAVGAKTIMITKAIMVITSPLSYPTSKILDLILGEEIGNVYNRERLKELVKVTTGINDLDKTEVNIISGALEMRKKTVGEVMTPIEDAFMLPLESILDFKTVSEIMKTGYSRVPVYDGDKRNIVTLLYIKDLAFVDTDDNTPLRTLCEFYQNPVHFVFEDFRLDVMFNQFKDGTIGHLAFVNRVNNEGDGDPFYETIGLVTLEDVIEELIQAEIVDETDVYVDNRTKTRTKKKQDFTAFAERKEYQSIRISPQLTLATYQYLSTAVDAFKKETISESILRRLLNQDIIHNIKVKGKDKSDPSLVIYQQGKAVDFFVLILEGRVDVTVGKESLLFESGPFTYFGTQALSPNVVTDLSSQQLRGSLTSLNMDAKIRQTFVPDYSVRATTDVIYIAIKRSLYFTAKKATLLEKSRKSGIGQSTEAIDDEVEKLLHSLTEDNKPFRDNNSIRKVSHFSGNGYNTASGSLNDLSQLNRSIPPATQQNSPGNTSANMMDGISLSSQVTSDQVNEMNSIENHADGGGGDGDDVENNVASIPLLPKSPRSTGDESPIK